MQAFFQPQSVVLIGVTRQTGVGAYNNLEMLLRYGYRGKVFVVHPKVPEILGIKTYPSVSQLPETPELAVISLGRERVLPVFTECAERGIRMSLSSARVLPMPMREARNFSSNWWKRLGLTECASLARTPWGCSMLLPTSARLLWISPRTRNRLP